MQKDEISWIEMKYKIFKFKKHLFKVNQITESEINPITTLSSSQNKFFDNLFKKKWKFSGFKTIIQYSKVLLQFITHNALSLFYRHVKYNNGTTKKSEFAGLNQIR